MTTNAQELNVQEAILRKKIDPYLTGKNLSALATQALGIRTHCADYSILTGGCWNRVITAPIDGGKSHLVFKVTPKIDDANLQREFAVLQYFRAHTAIPVPEPYLLDLTGKRVPGSVLVMTKIPGVVLQQIAQRLSEEAQRSVSEEIAEYIVNLHVRQEPGFGGVELPPAQRAATWPEFWLPRFDATLDEAQAKGLLDRELLAELAALRRELPRLLEIGSSGVLTHYDIWTGNVMVDFKGDRPFVSGFLDVIGYYADYARELSSMFSLADQWLMQVYRQRRGFDPGFEARFNVYSLKMCLQMICMYPTEPHHLENVRRYLRQAQVYCCEPPGPDTAAGF
jgi:fructosamine-3-kinase